MVRLLSTESVTFFSHKRKTAAQRRSMRLLRQQSGGGPPPSSKGDGSKRPMLGATKGQGDVRSQRLQKHCAMMDVWGKKKVRLSKLAVVRGMVSLLC